MKFKDFEVGMVIGHDPLLVDETKMLAFAHEYDPQPFHVDPQRAAASRWGGLIASGWMTCGLAMRAAYEAALTDTDSFGSPGIDHLRWVKPVHAGDRLRFEASVNSKRVSESNPKLGIVGWTWRMYNQDDELVLELEVTSLFDL